MPNCDLVLGGGGVRGVAHVGAIGALERADYTIQRVAGASAGAIAGALAVAGVPAARMQSLLDDLDARSFAFADLMSGARAMPLMASILERFGLDGPEPMSWLETVLEEHGIRTFADLRLPEEAGGPDAGPDRRWRLVVRCLDISNRRVVRLPWDYHLYGLDPDQQSVAEAVRASMSVPLVYRPVPIRSSTKLADGMLIDGGMGGGIPVRIFDAPHGQRPRWPSFGVRLQATEEDEPADLSSPLAMVRAVFETLLETADPLEHALPPDAERTVVIDGLSVRTMDVRNLRSISDQLLHAGDEAMTEFLRTYDFEAWMARWRVGEPDAAVG